ncbi:STN domain-containing protein [Sphingomonas sp. I4]
MALLLTASTFPMSAMPVAAQARQVTVDVNIPAQSLGNALAQFAQQAHLQLGVDATLVAGLRSGGVVGRMDRAAALDRLLAGSGLQWRLAGGVLTLQSSPRAPRRPKRRSSPTPCRWTARTPRMMSPRRAPSAAMTRSSTPTSPAVTRIAPRSNGTRASRRPTC